MAEAKELARGTDPETFTDVERNRNSLEVIPSRAPDEACLHRAVVGSAQAQTFSEQRGHPVFPVKLPGKAVSLSVGGLAPGARTSNHRHGYEALMYVIHGKGHTIIEGQRFDWQAGDALYTPPWCWHQHFAEEGHAVQYLTATNMPLLSGMGQTVIREEGSP